MPLIKIKVIPLSSRNQIVGWEGDTLKIKLTAPPVGGEANQALVNFLATFLKIPKSSVVLKHGLRSKQKTISIPESAYSELMSSEAFL